MGIVRKKKSNGEIRVNEYINVKHISGNILYTKDNYIACYVRIKPIVVSIMGEYEKWSLTDMLTTNFSSEKEPITIFKIDKPIDIRNLVVDYQNRIDGLKFDFSETKNKIKKDILTSNMLFLDKHAREGETLENLYYAMIFKRFDGNNEMALIKKAETFIQRFKMAGLESYLANDDEIKEICIVFANLGYATHEVNNHGDELNLITRYHLNS